MNNSKTVCQLGGIMKHLNGVGFKITFVGDDDSEFAKKYKDKIKSLLVSDNVAVSEIHGYMDKKE
jgi:hypothetical protein